MQTRTLEKAKTAPSNVFVKSSAFTVNTKTDTAADLQGTFVKTIIEKGGGVAVDEYSKSSIEYHLFLCQKLNHHAAQLITSIPQTKQKKRRKGRLLILCTQVTDTTFQAPKRLLKGVI